LQRKGNRNEKKLLRYSKVKMIEVKIIKSGSIILTSIILTYCFKLFEAPSGHLHYY